MRKRKIRERKFKTKEKGQNKKFKWHSPHNKIFANSIIQLAIVTHAEGNWIRPLVLTMKCLITSTENHITTKRKRRTKRKREKRERKRGKDNDKKREREGKIKCKKGKRHKGLKWDIKEQMK